ncbi:hypothetical protein MBLNU230_g5080t1 [Neophaeotheca triangularis]
MTKSSVSSLSPPDVLNSSTRILLTSADEHDDAAFFGDIQAMDWEGEQGSFFEESGRRMEDSLAVEQRKKKQNGNIGHQHGEEYLIAQPMMEAASPGIDHPVQRSFSGSTSYNTAQRPAIASWVAALEAVQALTAPATTPAHRPTIASWVAALEAVQAMTRPVTITAPARLPTTASWVSALEAVQAMTRPAGTSNITDSDTPASLPLDSDSVVVDSGIPQAMKDMMSVLLVAPTNSSNPNTVPQSTRHSIETSSFCSEAPTVTPVMVTKSAPENDGSLPMWSKAEPLSASEKQAARALQVAIASGADIRKAYGAAMADVVSAFVKIPAGVHLTAEEILIHLPNHLQIPAVVTRLLNGGWRRSSMGKKILSARGLLVDDTALLNTESRLQSQFETGWNTYYGVSNYSSANVEAFNAAILPTDTTPDEWHLREEYSLDSARVAKAHCRFRDCYLVDLAEGVALADFAQGDQAGVLTECIKEALFFDSGLKLSDVPAMIRDLGLTMPAYDASTVNPDRAPVADAVSIARPPKAPKPARLAGPGSLKTGKHRVKK